MLEVQKAEAEDQAARVQEIVREREEKAKGCLLYTSDAADE